MCHVVEIFGVAVKGIREVVHVLPDLMLGQVTQLFPLVCVSTLRNLDVTKAVSASEGNKRCRFNALAQCSEEERMCECL